MTDEPYRWLEAVANRREYIRDQLKDATPVFAVSRPEGVLLMGVGVGQSKVFEIYDRLALAALGHSVDIERVRQTAIEAAHLEGFTRDPADVTLRRLLNFSLCPTLKNSFEQVFAAPFLVELLMVELGADRSSDVLARVNFDGSVRYLTGQVAVTHPSTTTESAATEWLQGQLTEDLSLKDVVSRLVTAWRAMPPGKPFVTPPTDGSTDGSIPKPGLELALMDRRSSSRARYRILNPNDLA
jgi:proteasome alpha subunit